jgi:hypothetical protein
MENRHNFFSIQIRLIQVRQLYALVNCVTNVGCSRQEVASTDLNDCALKSEYLQRQ